MKKKENLIFYKGYSPGDQRRIKTGNVVWDGYFFMADNPKSASAYGCKIDKIDLYDSKILYEGTAEFNKIKKGMRRQFYLDLAADIAEKARQTGYDAVHFERQTDDGTVLFDTAKIKKRSAFQDNCLK